MLYYLIFLKTNNPNIWTKLRSGEGNLRKVLGTLN